jgi:polyisoprenoid-binding protein YceI
MIMKFFISLLLLLASGVAMAQMAQPSNFYTLDRAHSEMNFAIKWMNRGKVSGTFDNIGGTVHYDTKNPSRLSATLKINIKTLSTGIALRDGVLMKDWFDTAAHSHAYFETLPLSKEDKPGTIRGNFTLKGTTKVITLNIDTIDPPALDYQNDPFIIISGKGWFNRKDFNITMPTSRYETSLNDMVAISDSVLIEFNLVAKQSGVHNSLARISAPGSRSALLYEAVKNATPADIKQKINDFYRTPGPNPNSDISAWLVGTYFIGAKDLGKAIPLLEKSVEQFPNNANNCDAMMQAYYEAKNMKEAKKWMDELLALDPHHPGALEYKKRM